jgi:hypothetical protein
MVMPDKRSQTEAQLFMVWVWPEELEVGQVEWRGKAQHVGSGQARSFRDWETLVGFLRGQLSGREAVVPEGD